MCPRYVKFTTLLATRQVGFNETAIGLVNCFAYGGFYCKGGKFSAQVFNDGILDFADAVKSGVMEYQL